MEDEVGEEQSLHHQGLDVSNNTEVLHYLCPEMPKDDQSQQKDMKELRAIT